MRFPNLDTEVKEFSKAEEIPGKMQMNLEDPKLLHSIIQSDEETIDDGKLIKDQSKLIQALSIKVRELEDSYCKLLSEKD